MLTFLKSRTCSGNHGEKLSVLPFSQIRRGFLTFRSVKKHGTVWRNKHMMSSTTPPLSSRSRAPSVDHRMRHFREPPPRVQPAEVATSWSSSTTQREKSKMDTGTRSKHIPKRIPVEQKKKQRRWHSLCAICSRFCNTVAHMCDLTDNFPLQSAHEFNYFDKFPMNVLTNSL